MIGIPKHPQTIIRELGITYKDCECLSIADTWIFYECENVPKELPEYVWIAD